jgi:hypothetical protein
VASSFAIQIEELAVHELVTEARSVRQQVTTVIGLLGGPLRAAIRHANVAEFPRYVEACSSI